MYKIIILIVARIWERGAKENIWT